MTPEEEELFANLMALDENNDVRETFIKSPLNYMGSKQESLPWILDNLPKRSTWIDVFGGSGAVTIARPKSKFEVFNDRHSGVSAFFIAIQQNPQELQARIESLPHSREIFQWCKENVENTTVDLILRGAMWYILVQTSFAGRAAYWGRTTKPASPIHNKISRGLKLFYPLSERFSTIQIENLDWRQLFKDYDNEDVVWYLDPPYIRSNVYKYGMSETEHNELCKRALMLKGFVALSGFNNPIYNAYEWDHKETFLLRNNSASGATSGGSAMENKEIDRTTERAECLWIKD